MTGALVAFVDLHSPIGHGLVGAGTIRTGLTVSAAEGAASTGSARADAVALRFEDFYAAHRDEMARALGLAMRDAALGAEAADEAFARACQRWGQVGAYANPQGWVYRVGLNWARSWLRRARRERERQPLLAQPHSTEDRARDLDLERALASLNEAHRAVIVARFYLDWSVAETAEALGIATGTVKSRLSRGLEQLREVLESGSDEEEAS
ncbi:RNA polymerase sigma factor [Candidatus Poriferisodalis sp.]|uniref:RNA polymerase sigma factor n=1 Tax=Candidatus Poriferisodalis sp. TaxID=3101277 RepID=UPI003C6F7B3C